MLYRSVISRCNLIGERVQRVLNSDEYNLINQVFINSLTYLSKFTIMIINERRTSLSPTWLFDPSIDSRPELKNKEYLG